jgi:hypothetical protein
MTQYLYDETLEGILKMFHENYTLFHILSELMKDDSLEISEYLEVNK